MDLVRFALWLAVTAATALFPCIALAAGELVTVAAAAAGSNASESTGEGPSTSGSAGTGPSGGTSATDLPDAGAILQAVVDNLRGGPMAGTYTFVVERPGRVSEYVMEFISDGDRRGYVRVIAPPRDAGQAFLMDGDDLWVYNPRLGRSLRLPPSGRSNSFMGSDLSYSDIAGRDLEADYSAAAVHSVGDALALELLPRPGAPTPYGRVLVEVEPGNLTPRWVDYYDQRGRVVKRVLLSDYLPVGSRYIPLEMVVEDRVREGYRTIARLSGVEAGIPIPETCFTLQALERGCR